MDDSSDRDDENDETLRRLDENYAEILVLLLKNQTQVKDRVRHPRRKNLFEKNTATNYKLRPSVVDRALQNNKNAIPSSTPMPATRKRPFTPEDSLGVSAIAQSSAGEAAKGSGDAAARNSQGGAPVQNSVITLSSLTESNHEQTRDGRKSPRTSKACKLESVIAKIVQARSDKTVQTSDNRSLDYRRKMARRACDQVARERQTQTGDSLNRLRQGSVSSSSGMSEMSELIHRMDNEIFAGNNVVVPTVPQAARDERLPWRAPSGLKSLPTSDSLDGGFSEGEESDSDGSFLPKKKLPTKKVFTNKKKLSKRKSMTRKMSGASSTKENEFFNGIRKSLQGHQRVTRATRKKIDAGTATSVLQEKTAERENTSTGIENKKMSKHTQVDVPDACTREIQVGGSIEVVEEVEACKTPSKKDRKEIATSIIKTVTKQTETVGVNMSNKGTQMTDSSIEGHREQRETKKSKRPTPSNKSTRAIQNKESKKMRTTPKSSRVEASMKQNATTRATDIEDDVFTESLQVAEDAADAEAEVSSESEMEDSDVSFKSAQMAEAPPEPEVMKKTKENPKASEILASMKQKAVATPVTIPTELEDDVFTESRHVVEDASVQMTEVSREPEVVKKTKQKSKNSRVEASTNQKTVVTPTTRATEIEDDVSTKSQHVTQDASAEMAEVSPKPEVVKKTKQKSNTSKVEASTKQKAGATPTIRATEIEDDVSTESLQENVRETKTAKTKCKTSKGEVATRKKEVAESSKKVSCETETEDSDVLFRSVQMAEVFREPEVMKKTKQKSKTSRVEASTNQKTVVTPTTRATEIEHDVSTGSLQENVQETKTTKTKSKTSKGEVSTRKKEVAESSKKVSCETEMEDSDVLFRSVPEVSREPAVMEKTNRKAKTSNIPVPTSTRRATEIEDDRRETEKNKKTKTKSKASKLEVSRKQKEVDADTGSLQAAKEVMIAVRRLEIEDSTIQKEAATPSKRTRKKTNAAVVEEMERTENQMSPKARDNEKVRTPPKKTRRKTVPEESEIRDGDVVENEMVCAIDASVNGTNREVEAAEEVATPPRTIRKTKKTLVSSKKTKRKPSVEDLDAIVEDVVVEEPGPNRVETSSRHPPLETKSKSRKGKPRTKEKRDTVTALSTNDSSCTLRRSTRERRAAPPRAQFYYDALEQKAHKWHTRTSAVPSIATIAEEASENDEPQPSTSHGKGKVISGRVSKKTSNKRRKGTSASLETVASQVTNNFLSFRDGDQLREIEWAWCTRKFTSLIGTSGISMAMQSPVSMNDSSCCSGSLILEPGKMKPKQRTTRHLMTFVVLEGEAEVGVQEESGVFSTSDVFIVPRGCEYYIKNISTKKRLVLSFTRFTAHLRP